MYVVQLAEKKQGNILLICVTMKCQLYLHSLKVLGSCQQTCCLQKRISSRLLAIISQCLHQMREVVLFWIKLGSKSPSIFTGTEAEIKLSVSA